MIRNLTVALMLIMFFNGTATAGCPFDKKLLKFIGCAQDQALCLMRPVEKWGKLGPISSSLPEPLSTLLGSKFDIDASKIQKIVEAKGLSAKEIGGKISDPLSTAKAGLNTAPTARYFVIHDTSTPNYKKKNFPDNINTASMRHNNLSNWDKGSKSKAHLFINRQGESLSPVALSVPLRATKFELRYGNTDLKGLFVHVELVQPRRSEAKGPVGNDAVAPSPGFSNAQYSRLALLYVIASHRSGTWMIPVFHAAIDEGFVRAHDDPQSFSTERWAEHINIHLTELDKL